MTSPRAPRVVGRDPLPAALDGTWPASAEPETWLLIVSEYTSGPAADVPEKVLDAEERERAAKFYREEDRSRYVAAHLGLRQLLGAYLGMDPATVPFTREPCPSCGGPHGRPAVSGTPLHFNMSHAADLVFYAFAGSPIGVDVEKSQSVSVVDQIAASLHPTERTELARLPASLRPVAFGRCWTRKEAYLKGLGTGLSQDPSVSYVGTGPEPVPVGPWTLVDVPVDRVAGDYAAALALWDATRAGSRS